MRLAETRLAGAASTRNPMNRDDQTSESEEDELASSRAHESFDGAMVRNPMLRSSIAMPALDKYRMSRPTTNRDLDISKYGYDNTPADDEDDDEDEDQSPGLDLWSQMSKIHEKVDVRSEFDIDMMQALTLHLKTRDFHSRSGWAQRGLYGNALMCLHPENKFRIACYALVQHQIFSAVILILILINTVVLAVQAPLNDLGQETNDMLEEFDFWVTIIFTVEMLLKFVALGVYADAQSYFRDSWNVLDFFVVVTAWISIVVEKHGAGWGVNVSTFRALRAMRPLRQLRSLRFSGQTVLILKALGKCRYIVLPVSLLMFLVYVVATIVGLPLFRGLLSRSCVASGSNVALAFCPSSLGCSAQEVCSAGAGKWSSVGLNLNHDVNSLVDPLGFDSSAQTMVTLLITSALDGNAMETPERLRGTNSDVGWAVWPYFLVFLLMITCCLAHIFSAMIASVFREVAQAGQATLESERKLKIIKAGVAKGLGTILETAEKATTISKKNTDPPWKVKAKAIVASALFQNFIMGTILFNVVVMTLEYDGMSDTWNRNLYHLNNLCTIIFTIELLLKNATFGFFGYISNPINIFDGSIVMGSLIGWLYAEASGAQVGRLVRTFRLFRVGRIARVMIRTETVRALMAAVLKSTAPLFNLFFLTIFAMVLFSIFGMHFFHTPDDDMSTLPVRNYATFSEALLSVFHNIMQADWSIIMFGYIKLQGWSVTPFFLFVFVFCKYILMSLYMACLMNNYAMPPDEKLHRQKAHLSEQAQVLFDDFGMGKSLRGSMSSGEDGSDEDDDDYEEFRQAAGISGELLVETTRKQWAPRWFQVSGNHLIMFEHQHGARITNVPLSHICVRKQPKGLRKEAPHAFRLDVTVTSGTVGQHFSKFCLDPGTAERKAAWTEAIAANRTEGAEMHRRRALVGAMHKLLIRQDEIIDYVDKKIVKEKVIIMDKEVEKEMAPKVYTQARSDMRAFESFMELSFFDIGEVIELDDLVVAPRSCFCCTPYDSLRSLCISIAHSKSFEIGVSIVIALSMLAIAIEGPPGEYEKKNSSMRMFHEVTEIVFLALFWVEFGVKVTAFSFARHRYAYIRDWWNRFDFFVLVMGTTELAFSNAGMSFGSTLRAGRMLRVFRIVRRARGIQQVLEVLAKTVKDLSIVIVLQFVFFLIFSVFGMDLWMGMFKRCTVGSTCLEPDCHSMIQESMEYSYVNVTGKDECLARGGSWTNPAGLSFDNIFTSLHTLFVFALTTDRSRVFVAGLDAVAKGVQPSPTAQWDSFYFFLGFQLVVVMFFMNLFVVVIIRNMRNVRGSALLTSAQLQWSCVKRALRVHMQQSGNVRTMWKDGSPVLYRMVTDKLFTRIVYILIGSNLVINLFEHFPMEVWIDEWADTVNSLFLFLFSAEMAAKIASFGPRGYLSQRWDQFDGSIVIGSWLLLLIDAASSEGRGHGSTARIARSLRALRGLRLLRPEGPLAVVMSTLQMAFRGILNVCTVLIFNVFLFALIGVFMFGDLPFGVYYNAQNNFKSFGDAVLFLIKVTLGQHIVHVQHELSGWMYPYLILYQAISYLLIMNQYVAVIFNAFDLSWTPPSANTVTPEHIDAVTRAWEKEVCELVWFKSLSDTLQRKVSLVAHEVPLPLNTLPSVLSRLVTPFSMSDPKIVLNYVLEIEIQTPSVSKAQMLKSVDQGPKLVADSTWEPRFFRADAGRVFMYEAPNGYATVDADVPEDAPCIFSVPCDQIEVSLPSWKRPGAPYAFKLSFFERELEPEVGMNALNVQWQKNFPNELVVNPPSKRVQDEWLDFIERGRRNYFIWVQQIMQQLELDNYCRRYTQQHDSMMQASMDAAQEKDVEDYDSEEEEEDLHLRTLAKSLASFDEEHSKPNSRGGILSGVQSLTKTMVKGEVTEETSSLDFVSAYGPNVTMVAYEQLALTLHMTHIGRGALTLHSRVERDAFMIMFLANKLIATMVQAWLEKRRARKMALGARTVNGCVVPNARTHVFAIHCAAWWRGGMLVSQRRLARHQALISDPAVVSSIETMIDQNVLASGIVKLAESGGDSN